MRGPDAPAGILHGRTVEKLTAGLATGRHESHWDRSTPSKETRIPKPWDESMKKEEKSSPPMLNGEVERKARVALRLFEQCPPEGARGPKTKLPRLRERHGWLEIVYRGRTVAIGIRSEERAKGERVLARLLDLVLNGNRDGLPLMLTEVNLGDVVKHHQGFADPMTSNRNDPKWQRYRRCWSSLRRIEAYFGSSCGLHRVSPAFAAEYMAWRTGDGAYFLRHCRSPRLPMPEEPVSAYTAARDLEELERRIAAFHADRPLAYLPTMNVRVPTSRRKGVFQPQVLLRILKAFQGYVWDWQADDWETETVLGPDGEEIVREKRSGGPLGPTTLDRLERFFVLGFLTGTRHRTLVDLRWCPSADRGYVDVERLLIHRKGDGNSREGKAKHSGPLVPFLGPILRQWRDRDHAEGHVAIFRRLDGEQLASPLSKDWRALMVVAGIVPPPHQPDARRLCDADAVPHVLRHTLATILKQLGVPIDAAAAYTGMSERTLKEIYGQCSLVDALPAARALANIGSLDELHRLPPEVGYGAVERALAEIADREPPDVLRAA